MPTWTPPDRLAIGFGRVGEDRVDELRVAVDDAQQQPRGRVGAIAFLLPVLHGVELEAEAQRELRLGQTETLADALGVNVRRHDGRGLHTQVLKFANKL